jgi:uncharacterized protein YaaN involved in tellurite resistance
MNQQQVTFPSLNSEEQELVSKFSEQIDLNDTKRLMNYGVKSQTALTQFSSDILGQKSLRDVNSIGESISILVLKLRDATDVRKQTGLLGIFKRTKYAFDKRLLDNSNVNKVVGEIETKLMDHMMTITENVKLLTKLEELNFAHYKELTMYIDAGKTALSKDPENENVEFFEKRLADLQLSRTMSSQLAVQIKMIKANNLGLADKVQSSINVVIPLWKTQLLINANLQSSNEALKAQTAITDMTNSMIVKNAEDLNTTVLETAKQVGRGIVDIESLKHVNQQIINVFNDVQKVISENRAIRMNVENELVSIETILKDTITRKQSVLISAPQGLSL